MLLRKLSMERCSSMLRKRWTWSISSGRTSLALHCHQAPVAECQFQDPRAFRSTSRRIQGSGRWLPWENWCPTNIVGVLLSWPLTLSLIGSRLITAFYYENFHIFPDMAIKKSDSGRLTAHWPLMWTDGPLGAFSVAETGAYVLTAFKNPAEWIGQLQRFIFLPLLFFGIDFLFGAIKVRTSVFSLRSSHHVNLLSYFVGNLAERLTWLRQAKRILKGWRGLRWLFLECASCG